jgi:hypothetical protein
MGWVIPLVGTWIAAGFVKDVAKFLREGKTQEAILAQAKYDKSTTAEAEKKMVNFLMSERARDRQYREEIQPQRERENMVLGYALQQMGRTSQVPGQVAEAIDQFAQNQFVRTEPPPSLPQMSVANLLRF